MHVLKQTGIHHGQRTFVVASVSSGWSLKLLVHQCEDSEHLCACHAGPSSQLLRQHWRCIELGWPAIPEALGSCLVPGGVIFFGENRPACNEALSVPGPPDLAFPSGIWTSSPL